MVLLVENSNLWDTDAERLRQEFEVSNKVLNVVQKALSEYLEAKRIAFPRFYFISDEDLLDILARSKDPEAFQRHLNKCFESINTVELSD